jgi:hypothetical protein
MHLRQHVSDRRARSIDTDLINAWKRMPTPTPLSLVFRDRDLPLYTRPCKRPAPTTAHTWTRRRPP